MTTTRDPWQGVGLPVRPDDAIVPPWKRLHRDILSSGPLRRCGLEGFAVFAALIAAADVHGRVPGEQGDTVAQTVGAAIGFPPEAVERPLRALLRRRLLLRYGDSGVRFAPESWARRQQLQAFGQGAESREPATVSATPLPAELDAPASAPQTSRSTPPVDLSDRPDLPPRRVPMCPVERLDRCRFGQVADGKPAVSRLRHYAHPSGMAFEVWLACEPNGVRLLQYRREKNPDYAPTVTVGVAVSRAATPLSGNDRAAFPAARETTGNVTAAFPVREVGILSSGKEERREEQTTEGNVTAGERVTRETNAGGVSRETPVVTQTTGIDVPEIPELPTVDDPRIATGQRLTEGYRTLRALIDRANEGRRGAVVELGATNDAMRFAALHLQNAGVTPTGNPMDTGVRLFDAMVALLRDPSAMRRVLGRWQRVKDAGYALPLNVCGHKEGMAMGQLVAEAQKIVRNREMQGPVLPLEMPRVAAAPVDGDAILYVLDENLQLVEQSRVSGSGVRS